MAPFQRKGQECCVSFPKGKPSFSLSTQIYQRNGTAARRASLAALATRLASPIKQSVTSCGLEMLVLGLFFMAYLAWQDHEQCKGKFQNLSERLHMNLCAMSALQWSRGLLQYRRDSEVLMAPPGSHLKG